MIHARYPAIPPPPPRYAAAPILRANPVVVQSREAENATATAAVTASTEVTVDAADFPTAGGMFRNALESLTASPDLLWLDLPCDGNGFDACGDEAGEAGSLWAGRDTAGVAGAGGDPYWKSLVEVRTMGRENGGEGEGGVAHFLHALVVRPLTTHRRWGLGVCGRGGIKG